MANWIRLLTFKELLQYFIYKSAFKIVGLSGYHKTCKLVKEQIQELETEGYHLRRKGKDICINILGENNLSRYLIRPKTSDGKVFKQVIIQKEYQSIIDLINKRNNINSIKKIIDAGANIGLTTLFFNQHFPDALVISIEPDEKNFIQLKKNISINKINKSAKLLKYALWKNNTDKLSISNDFRDGESWSRCVSTKKNKTSQYVNAITLRQVMNSFIKEGKIDILKVDIEGSEAELFKSSDFIKMLESSVRFLCLEIHDELNVRQDIYKVFSQINFSFEMHGETCCCANNNFN